MRPSVVAIVAVVAVVAVVAGAVGAEASRGLLAPSPGPAPVRVEPRDNVRVEPRDNVRVEPRDNVRVEPRDNVIDAAVAAVADIFGSPTADGCVHGAYCGPGCAHDGEPTDDLDAACREYSRCVEDDESGAVDACRCDAVRAVDAVYDAEHRDCAWWDLSCWQPDLAKAAEAVRDWIGGAPCPDPPPPPPSPPPPACAFVVERDVAFVYGDVADFAFADAPETCCALCAATDACFAWTWVPDNPACEDGPCCALKAAEGYERAGVQGAVSGVRP